MGTKTQYAKYVVVLEIPCSFLAYAHIQREDLLKYVLENKDIHTALLSIEEKDLRLIKKESEE